MTKLFTVTQTHTLTVFLAQKLNRCIEIRSILRCNVKMAKYPLITAI